MRFRSSVPRGLAALAVAALVAAGCSSGGGDTTAAGGADPSQCPTDALASADGPVEIEFWHARTASNEETLEEMVADYNDSQDQVQVDLVFTGSYNETLDRYLTALRGGDLPDLVQLEETALQLMVDSQSAVPAEACVDSSGYDLSDHLPRVIDQFTVEDVLWPMPFNVSNPVLYYNKTAFSAAGLDPASPPQTLDEITEAARALVDSGATRSGFSLEVQAWYPEQWLSKAGQTVVDEENGRVARANEATLENPAGEDVFEWISTMTGEGLAVSVGRNPSGADHLLAIATNDAGMTIGTSAALGSIYDVLDAGDFPDVDLGVAPLPGEDVGGVTVGGAALWLVNESSPEEIAASWDFVTWLNEPEQLARWHTGTGYIPTTGASALQPEVTELWAERPGFEVAYRQITEGGPPPGGGGAVIGGYPEFRDVIQLAIERIVLEGQDPAEALAQAQAEATAAIQEYNSRVGE